MVVGESSESSPPRSIRRSSGGNPARISAASNRSSRPSTRRMPARRRAVSTTRSAPASAPECVAAGQGSRLMASCLEHDHRLDARRGTGGRHELPRLGHRLQIHDDCACRSIAGKQVKPVADVDIRHVPERDDVGETNTVVGCPIDQRRDDRPRLGKQRDVARLRRHMREAGVELERWDHQADRVRPDDPEEVRSCRVQHRLPQSVLTRESGSDDDSGPAALGAESPTICGTVTAGVITMARSGVAGSAAAVWKQRGQQPLRIWVHRPDRPFEAAPDDVLHDNAAQCARTCRSAEDGQRSRARCEFKILMLMRLFFPPNASPSEHRPCCRSKYRDERMLFDWMDLAEGDDGRTFRRLADGHDAKSWASGGNAVGRA